MRGCTLASPHSSSHGAFPTPTPLDMASAGRVRPVIALGAARSARAPRRAAARALFGRGGAEKRAGAKGAKSKEELARDSRPSFKVGPALRSGDDRCVRLGIGLRASAHTAAAKERLDNAALQQR